MKPVLILDLDETLIHTELEPQNCDFEFELEGKIYYTKIRPFFHEFIDYAFQNFEVAIWTASSEDYAKIVLKNLNIDLNKLKFFFTKEKCTIKYSYDYSDYYGIKNLQKLKKRGISLDRVLIVDDRYETAVNNWGNLIRIEPFINNSNDVELLKLISYLEIIKDETNFRTIDKRGWSSRNENII